MATANSKSCWLPVGDNGELGPWIANFFGHSTQTRRNLRNAAPELADVDGDGKLELGVIHDGGIFRCYDATTGNLKWELKGIKQTTEVVTADVDGDGRPEFVAGLAAFKAIDQTSGKVLWEADVPAAHAPVIADLDGDGFVRLILGCTDGKIRVYK